MTVDKAKKMWQCDKGDVLEDIMKIIGHVSGEYHRGEGSKIDVETELGRYVTELSNKIMFVLLL